MHHALERLPDETENLTEILIKHVRFILQMKRLFTLIILMTSLISINMIINFNISKGSLCNINYYKCYCCIITRQ